MLTKDENLIKNADIMKELNDAFSGATAPKLTKAQQILRNNLDKQNK